MLGFLGTPGGQSTQIPDCRLTEASVRITRDGLLVNLEPSDEDFLGQGTRNAHANLPQTRSSGTIVRDSQGTKERTHERTHSTGARESGSD